MNRDVNNCEVTALSTVTPPDGGNNKNKCVAELEKALHLLNRRCDWQSKRIAEFTRQRETMNMESTKMARELCYAKRLLSTNFDLQEVVNKLFEEGEEKFDGKNQIIIEKSPLGAVSIEITATKELVKLRKMAQLSEMRVSQSEALVHHLQKFMKELVTDSGDYLHEMTRDKMNEYLKQKGWDKELEAQDVGGLYDEFSWFLHDKRHNPVPEAKDQDITDLGRPKKRSHTITVHGI